MKRILLISLLLLAVILTVNADRRRMLGARNVASAGIVCSGAILSDGTERFESGTGAFCLTGWTETDTVGALDSFNSVKFVTGTKSMRVDLTNAANSFIYANPADDAFSVRFYLHVTNWVNGMGAGAVVDIFQTDNETSFAGSPSIGVNLRRSGTPACAIQLRTGATDTAGPNLTENTWYRVEVTCNRNATSTMRVYSIGGAQLGTDVTATGADAAGTYFCFGKESADTGSATIFIDNIIYSAAGTFPIGSDE